MKKTLLLLIFGTSALFGDDFRVIFLTYPRSGRSWLSYCLENIIGEEKVQGLWTRYRHSPAHPRSPAGKIEFIYNHFSTKIPKDVDDQTDFLLVIVRNPIESFIRHCGSSKNAIHQFRAQTYLFRNLEYFGKWNPERRHLVYYEDLIRNPKKELEKTLRALGQYEEEKLQNFLDELPLHRQNCLDYYDATKIGGAQSRGEDLNYHANQNPEKYRRKLISMIKTQFPSTWKRYLSRYDVIEETSLSTNVGS